MVSINGYFDGNACIPLDKADVSPNQSVIITFLDSQRKLQPHIKRCVSLIQEYQSSVTISFIFAKCFVL